MPFLKKQNKSKHLNGRKLKNSKRQRNLVFQNCGTIDVTYFDAMTPDDFIGYLSGGSVQVFSDGDLIIYSEDEKSILENINLTDLIKGSNNINNFDPKSRTAVSLMTKEKDIRISFQSIEIKLEFWNTISKVYDNLII